MRYLDDLHGDSKGWITLCTLGSQFSHYHYKVVDLLEMDLEGENNFLSMSTFFKPQRRIENIKELRALFIDVDCYKVGMTKEQVLFFLEEDYFGEIIPNPTYIIDSGRGLYLEWLIQAVPSQALPLWKSVEEYIYSKLKEYGADRQSMDATRILRIPGSINPKAQKKVEVLYSDKYRYTLREIQREYLPDLEDLKKKKRGRPKKIVSIYRERQLYQARLQDIATLCELRGYDMEGERELILFLYRYYVCYFTEDIEKALEDVLELNEAFVKPLPKREAIRATRSAEKAYKEGKQYKYRNDTLIELLGITEEEQVHMKTIIGKPEYRRRDREYQKQKYSENREVLSQKAKDRYHKKLKENGKPSEVEKISIRRQKIKDLLGKGLLRKDICSTLNISKRTYNYDIEFLKEQGLY